MVGDINLEDIERELKNREHELDELANTNPAGVEEVKQALYSVRETLAHIQVAIKKGA